MVKELNQRFSTLSSTTMQDAGCLSVPTKQRRMTVRHIFADYFAVRCERTYVKRENPFRCDCKCQGGNITYFVDILLRLALILLCNI